jgi:hypothetical protein
MVIESTYDRFLPNVVQRAGRILVGWDRFGHATWLRTVAMLAGNIVESIPVRNFGCARWTRFRQRMASP